MVFILKSILSDMSTATPAFFFFAWKFFFHPFTFNLCESFVMRWVSCKQHIDESCFLIQSATLCLFFFLSSPEDILPFFVQIEWEWEGERGREREANIDAKGTHRVAATRTTNQGWGQTATEVRALSGNRNGVSPDRRWTLQPLSQTGQGYSVSFYQSIQSVYI
uniref:Uncharacterized protein n=1 Tax=Molossus molossus TaxID=27622 RepID=A0A7J8I9R2_MOLMO|nr:hypothetical protein HJG59_010699 [Molossus molossus]